MKIKIAKVKKGAILLFFIILLFFMSEIILKFRYGPYSVGSAYGAPIINFEDEFYKLNSKRLRDREFSYVTQDNVFRVLVLGDSNTFGQGIKDHKDTYPKLLEKKLNNNNNNNNKEDITYEIINAGVRGFGTKDELNYWNKEGIKYNPDLVIIAYFFDDLGGWSSFNGTLPSSFKGKTNLLNDRSYLYFFFNYRIVKRLYEFWNYKLPTFLNKNTINNDKNYLRELRTHISVFNKLIKSIKDNQSVPLVIILPDWFYEPDYSQEYVRQKFEEFQKQKYIINKTLEEQGKDYLKIENINRLRKKMNLIVNKDDPHPNEKAHEIIADEIYSYLIKSELLNKRK
jgi:lysophospholipase L1-like esterase